LIGVRCPVQYLVPAQGAENQVLDEVSTAFQAAKPPGMRAVNLQVLFVSLNCVVWLSGMCWAIEQCFEKAKSELGLGHYQVRKFRGWHQPESYINLY
jgi:hypothetical protein